MRYAFWLTLAASVLFGVVGFNPNSLQTRQAIVDVSWPNCDARPEYNIAFGIVGATGGLNFRKNSCLSQETTWFQNYALYMNTGYPGASYGKKYLHSPKYCSPNDNYCLAYNWGYNAALFALTYAAKQNVHSYVWWLDVETVNSWSANGNINRQSLIGAVDAIRSSSLFPSIGFYAYPGQWSILTNNWRNDYPAWVATGSEERSAAVTACTQPSFTGGTVVITQYTTSLDNNIVCGSTTFEHMGVI